MCFCLRSSIGGKNLGLSGFENGDNNTRFFHCVANSNRRFNTIGRLLVNETVSTDQEEIGEELVRFYKNLFSDDGWFGILLH